MNTKLVNSTAGVINAALTQNRTAAGIAMALESAGLLMTPETGVELESLRARVAELEAGRAAALREGAAAIYSRSGHEREVYAELLLRMADGRAEYRFCGADLGRDTYPFTCNRRIGHDGNCGPGLDGNPGKVFPEQGGA